MSSLRPYLLAPALPFLIWVSLWVLPAQAETGGTRSAMADAMSRMMEAMGLFGSGATTPGAMYGGGMPSPFGMPGSGMGMPGWPGGNMGAPFGGGGQMWDQFSRSVPGMSQMPQMPWSGSALEGPWEAAGGGLLLVQGPYYRLYAPNGAYVDGSLQITGDRLRMSNSQAGFELAFEYAIDQEGRLAMRDENGQIYLYRRLVLKGGGG
jgi:hypothetical protein